MNRVEFSKKVRPEIIYVHGDAVVPAKDLSYKKDDQTGEVVEKVRPNTHKFENDLKKDLEKELIDIKKFPTSNEVMVTLNCGFNSKSKYNNCDLDNTSKTILDALKGPIYADDSQVKILLTHKEYFENAQESYFRFTVKILNKSLSKLIFEDLNKYQRYN